MHGLWSIWTTLRSTALQLLCSSHGTLELGQLCSWQRTTPHAEFNTQAHPGSVVEKVTRIIWEGSVGVPLILMSREGLNFQMGFVLHWEWMFLLSSNGLHNPFHACLIPFENKPIRHLTKQTLFSSGAWVDFYFSKSVGFNPIRCFGERREQVTNKI